LYESVDFRRGTFCRKRGSTLEEDEILKKENYSRGVVIRQEEEGVAVDVYIIVGYGTKISAICRNVQEQVKYNLETMLGFSANTVNVYVQGVKIIEA